MTPVIHGVAQQHEHLLKTLPFDVLRRPGRRSARDGTPSLWRQFQLLTRHGK